MNKLNSKGFSALEGILILVIVGLVGFVGWYVWDQNKKTPSPVSQSNTIAPKSSTTSTEQNKTETQKTPATTFAKPEAKLVKFTSQKEFEATPGVAIPYVAEYETVAPHAKVYKGAPDDLKKLAIEQGSKVTDEAYGGSAMFSIDYLSKNKQYAAGALGGLIVFKKIDGKWTKLEGAGGQAANDCSIIKKYVIPMDIIGNCLIDQSAQDYTDFMRNLTE